MNISRLKERIKRFEGLRLKPYYDTEGYLTIGYGRNLELKGITEREAEFLLDQDIRDAYLDFIREFPPKAKLNLTEEGEEVIAEMIFNMGIKKVLGFRKMIRAIEEGDPEKAAYEMLDSRWHRQVGARAEELAEIMRTRGIRKAC